jgi:hypothetical protein
VPISGEDDDDEDAKHLLLLMSGSLWENRQVLPFRHFPRAKNTHSWLLLLSLVAFTVSRGRPRVCMMFLNEILFMLRYLLVTTTPLCRISILRWISGLNICMPLHIIFDTPLAGPFKGCQGNVEDSKFKRSRHKKAVVGES